MSVPSMLLHDPFTTGWSGRLGGLRLTAMRDALLPMLLSAKIGVAESYEPRDRAKVAGLSIT
jgi:hypothetical protein